MNTIPISGSTINADFQSPLQTWTQQILELNLPQPRALSARLQLAARRGSAATPSTQCDSVRIESSVRLAYRPVLAYKAQN
jgi:hypothetical protein